MEARPSRTRRPPCGQPPCEKNSTSGTRPSTAVPPCAKNPRQPAWAAGRRGSCSKNARFEGSAPHERAVRHHRRDHEREVLVQLRGRRAHPDDEEDQLGGDDDVRRPANRKARASGAYTSPRAARKITLSRRPSTASTPRIATVCQRGSTPIAVSSAGIGPMPSETQRDHQQRPAARRTAARRPACGRCPRSTARGSATVAAGSSRAAASTGSIPSAGSSDC